jgi:hypothetical protein
MFSYWTLSVNSKNLPNITYTVNGPRVPVNGLLPGGLRRHF